MCIRDSVEVGDRILSSGYGSVYPRELVIGHVTEIEKDPYSQSITVYIQPAASLSDEDRFMIITEYDSYTESQKRTERPPPGERTRNPRWEGPQARSRFPDRAAAPGKKAAGLAVSSERGGQQSQTATAQAAPQPLSHRRTCLLYTSCTLSMKL